MASVFLQDLDDFIAPGQACINPLFTTPDEAPAAASKGDAPMQLVLEDDGGPPDLMQLGYIPNPVHWTHVNHPLVVIGGQVDNGVAEPDLIRASGNQTAKVSLDDCLACSGCVTSAETVLITQQSTGKLQQAIESGRYEKIVVSISPQARASLAARFGLTTVETHARLAGFLRQMGVHFLFDSSLAADFSLLEAGEEFAQRYGRVSEGDNGTEDSKFVWAAPPPTVALSSTRRFNVEAGREEQTPSNGNASSRGSGGGIGRSGDDTKRRRFEDGVGSSSGGGVGATLKGIDAAQAQDATASAPVRLRGPGELLVLTSACPGWVCYAEKTAPEALPFISTVKSEQQIMGILAKRVFPRAWDLSRQEALGNDAGDTPGNLAKNGSPLTSTTTYIASGVGLASAPQSSGPRQAVFHASIAQCYDKKLEASRKDFRHENGVDPHRDTGGGDDNGGGAKGKTEITGEAEVDLVLTTAEVLELIEERFVAAGVGQRAGADGRTRSSLTRRPSFGEALSPAVAATPTTIASLSSPKSPAADVNSAPDDPVGEYFRSVSPIDLTEPLAPGFPTGQASTVVSEDGLSLYGGVVGEGMGGGGSGGYLEHVFRYAALRLFGVDLAGQALVYREGRNADFRETSLEVDGKVVLRFAYAYGFRNIQSILAKARRGKCPYHFVEVMACPSGCVNGGGQIKPKGKKEGPRDTRERVASVSEVLRSNRVARGPQESPLVQAVYKEFLEGKPGGMMARGLLHTSYHNVPKLELSNPHMSPW